jgi:Asp-tRNA(Asn)/Glu-tRNA(Gln) amidotransferase A subunit family amidase
VGGGQAPFNYSGQPTITIPCGVTATAPQKPLCFQLVGNLLQEELLCKLGYAYESHVNRQFRPLVPTSFTSMRGASL